MSFGFSPADILTGIKTCEWLYTNCFDKNNAADERYKQFGNDVKLLEARLEQLMRAFQQALNRYEQPDLDARDLRCDLKDIVGDFQQTIDQSVEVLNKHVNLRRNRAGSIDSIIWAPNSQDKIDALGRRIQFHTQKIYLVMEPVTLGLLATIDARADEIQYLMRTYFAIESPLPPLPIWLDSWLQDTILENPPPGFSDIYTIPLKDGFDALYSHFRESTYAFRDPETADQTVEQYLNLLKSQWLLEVLRNGQSFQNARPGSLYPRTLAQLEQRIMNQYRRQDIVYFNDDYLRQLSRTAFLIWPPEEEVVQNKFMTDPNVGEEEILKISVPNYFGAAGKDNLVVFRTGPATLRIVRSVQGDRSGTPYYESERFNIHIDRYIPFYAIAENLLGPGRRRSSGAVSSVGIYRGNETGETSYDLKEEKDMLDFQRAVTGYQVVFDNNPAWALNHSPKLSRGKGKVQIWHWKPLTQDNRARRDSISSSSSATSGMSQLTGATATVEMVLKGRDRSRISIHERPETNDATLGASTPPLPIIMVYSREGGEYSYYHIELGFGMQIVETACDCNKNSKTCRRSVIEKRRTKGSESNFQVRRVTTDLSAWNLSLFAHPRHPNFDNRKIMQSIDCKFLNLDFDTVADREDFTRKFNKALQLRDSAEVDFRRICNRTSFLSEKSGEVKINEPERKGGPLSRLARSSTGSSFRDRFSYRSELASDSDTVRPIEISGMPAPPVELHGTSLPSIGISGMPLSPVELHGTSLPSVGMPIPPVELHGTSLPRLRPISRVSSFNIKGIGGKFFG